MDYTKLETISIKSHPELNERWIQDRIADDPSILGLGDVVLKDRERRQPRAGRLDILLQDADMSQRYEVEIQLGATDESHIIRTIEYWDIERKRYPQYEHTAVIVAEDITSRFLNVVNLFNGTIPLVAIQMKAIMTEKGVGLFFTKVIDQMPLGLVDEDEEVQEPADRGYWEDRASKKTLAMVDKLLEIVEEKDPDLELKYNKFYIGLAKDGLPKNFIIFSPKKSFLRFEFRLEKSEDIEERLEAAGLDEIDFSSRRGFYKIRLHPEDVEKHKDIIREIIAKSYEFYGM